MRGNSGVRRVKRSIIKATTVLGEEKEEIRLPGVNNKKSDLISSAGQTLKPSLFLS